MAATVQTFLGLAMMTVFTTEAEALAAVAKRFGDQTDGVDVRAVREGRWVVRQMIDANSFRTIVFTDEEVAA